MLDSAMAAWMASPGHREAILVPAYKFVDLGLAWREDGWGYGFHAVQMFEGDYVEYQAPPAIEYGGRVVLAGSRETHLSPEDVAVGAGPHQGDTGVVFVPDQEPVTFDVAFPQGRQIADELVDPVAGFQRFACDEPFDDLPEPLFVLAAPGGPAEVPSKSRRQDQFAHPQTQPSPDRPCRTWPRPVRPGPFGRCLGFPRWG